MRNSPARLDRNAEISHLPLITVVTVVFNGEKFLDDTIRSVIALTYPKVEYIIIDGGSTDGTLNIIKNSINFIDFYISESDQGIYDAMNKALSFASGEWIIFLNAGDVFFAPNTLDLVFSASLQNKEVDVLYGNVHIRYSEFSRIEKAGKLSRLWSGMKFSHQSVFVRLAYHKLSKFNVSNRIAADLEFFYSAYKKDAHFKYVDLTISSVITGGISESNRIKTILASRDAILKTNDSIAIAILYCYFCVDAGIRSLFKNILPKKITKFIISKKG
jgi:glycosyltransferase involved in cell wall biosynthesis